MTLIVAIQMEDSVIVAADNRVVIPSPMDNQKNYYHSDQRKLHLWHGGVVTGCGEIQVPQEIRTWLQKNSELDLLAEKLTQIKNKRIIEVGYHEQIADSKVLFTKKQNNKPQLYLLGLQPLIRQVEPNELTIFCPLKPSLLAASMMALKKLHVNIRPTLGEL